MDVNWVQTKPIVMNEALLREAVRGQLSQELDDCEAIEEINFSEILQLQLQFRRIVKIDHLFGFKSLTRLEINNNHIEKIEGLDCLVNLIWLNMSFNNIEKIEGLGSLRKLEVVNFTNNSISVIENMDTLEKLTHFNIANNHIGQLDNVCYLSKFVDLFSLTLQGNPVAEDDSYKLFIAAHLPKLMSLDNRILDENTKKEAFIKYQTVIGILKFKELKRDNEAEVEAEVKLHKNAFVEFLNGPYLFKSLFKDDLKEERLNSVPEVAPLLEEFEQQMVALCEKIFEIGLDEHKRRESEVSTFVSAQKEAMTDCRQKMSEISVEFERKHKKVITELKQLSDPNLVRTRINHHNDEITQHCENMLTVECQLVRHLEDITEIFDVSISDMVDNFTENVQELFARCQDLDKDYLNKIKEVLVEILANAAEDDMQNEEKMPFTEETEVTNAMDTALENHQATIKDRETQLVTRVNDWKTALIEEIKDNINKQHAMYITDRHRYVDHLRMQLEAVQKNHE